MGLYNFKKQFEHDIMADLKRHTIRAKRKYPDKPGRMLHLYVGLRQKGARLLKRRQCTKVQDISILHGIKGWYTPMVLIDGVELSRPERELLARSDGFRNFRAMILFWDGRLPFKGDLIHWESDRAALVRELSGNRAPLAAKGVRILKRYARLETNKGAKH